MTYPCSSCNMDEGSPVCLQDERCPRHGRQAYAEQFAMSKYASSADRSAAMFAELERLTREQIVKLKLLTLDRLRAWINKAKVRE